MVLAAVVLVVIVCDRTMHARVPKTIVTREFKSFQRNYLYVYVCALGAEWLQDSHLFALLLRHGHGLDQVASLFAAGFVVSYLWGVFADCVPGGAATLFGGGRSACIACFGCYGAAALTVFHDDYATLLLGQADTTRKQAAPVTS